MTKMTYREAVCKALADELRSDEDVRKRVEYICANPVRAGLSQHEDDYPWLWREWIEGAAP